MKTNNIFRMLLVAVALLLGANNVKADIIWQDSNGSTQIGIPYGTFTNEMEGSTLRFTYSLQRQNGWTPQYKVEMYRGGNNALVFSQPITDDGSDESTFDIILTPDVFSKINTTDQYNVCGNVYGSWVSIKKIEILSGSSTSKTDVTLTYSATTASATTASIGETLANAPTLSSSVEGLTFTYESSNTSVAEVSTEGVVTIKGAGTTVIKAKFAGDDTYNSAEASYTLTITEATYSVTIGETTNGQISTSPTTDVTAGTTVTITATPSEGYKLSTITVTGADETNVELSGTGNTRTFTMPSQNVTVSATFAEIETIEATITSTIGFATFCSNKALDFTGINTIEAYYAKTVENGNVYLLRIYGTVKAGTGLVLKGATTRIPVAESGDELEGNMLIGVSADTDVNASTDYVLTEKNGVAVFAQTGVNKATVAAGHAYLRVPVAQARTRAIGIGGEGTTGIDNTFIDNCEQGEMVIYNLGGQRVKNAAKGLFIINGKKKILK